MEPTLASRISHLMTNARPINVFTKNNYEAFRVEMKATVSVMGNREIQAFDFLDCTRQELGFLHARARTIQPAARTEQDQKFIQLASSALKATLNQSTLRRIEPTA